MVQNGYTEYDTVKVKLRVNDDSLRNEIQLYMHEIDQLVTNRIRNKIGEFNIYGQAIVYPLTFETIPTVDLELKAIANDLVVAKIRLQNSEKPLLWDSAVKILDDYLEKRFGWTRDVPFTPERDLTVSPTFGLVGATITLGGIQWQPTVELTITFDGSNALTTPTDVITDSSGTWSGVTFTVPASTDVGITEIKVADKIGGKTAKFQVTE